MSGFNRTQIKSALKQRMYEQSMVQTGSPKKAQKRPAGQADGVKAKKPKEQGDCLELLWSSFLTIQFTID